MKTLNVKKVKRVAPNFTLGVVKRPV
jgi:hypothetical protein